MQRWPPWRGIAKSAIRCAPFYYHSVKELERRDSAARRPGIALDVDQLRVLFVWANGRIFGIRRTRRLGPYMVDPSSGDAVTFLEVN
jgi:hypothetical protein